MGGERKIGRSFCEHVDQAEAQAEIGRLLTDSRFQSPERNRNFLRFIATEFFEGRAEAIKAYAIAVDVFGRPANFDPSVDPIVRIEATRLRAALTQYYDAHGSDTGIRVDLPRGRYVPVFTRMVPNDMPPRRSKPLSRMGRIRLRTWKRVQAGGFGKPTRGSPWPGCWSVSALPHMC